MCAVSGAGTDANVFLTLFGDLGDTGERPLKHSDSNINKFEQNDVDVFTLEAADLGQLYKCFVRHDNKGEPTTYNTQDGCSVKQ